jgi:hypothetical protein
MGVREVIGHAAPFTSTRTRRSPGRAHPRLLAALGAPNHGLTEPLRFVHVGPRVYAALGIEPEQERIVGVVWIGYPLRADADKPRRRRSLEQVLRVLP